MAWRSTGPNHASNLFANAQNIKNDATTTTRTLPAGLLIQLCLLGGQACAAANKRHLLIETGTEQHSLQKNKQQQVKEAF